MTKVNKAPPELLVDKPFDGSDKDFFDRLDSEHKKGDLEVLVDAIRRKK